MTKFEFDLYCLMTFLYVKFELNLLYRWGDNERKLKISYYFQSKRGITAKHHRTMTKFELDLSFLMTYPYVKFELNVCNRYQDNERKLMMTEGQNTICPINYMTGA
jgi:hypothetical protein